KSNNSITFKDIVLISALSSNHLNEFLVFLENKREFHVNNKHIVYNIGLNGNATEQIEARCPECIIRNFNFSSYPPHVSSIGTYAFKVLIIQETLREFGSIFWCDTSVRFKTSYQEDIIQQLMQTGVVSWHVRVKTAQYTHPDMFEYFNTTPDKYEDQVMIEPGRMLLLDTPRIQQHLIEPCVRCALNPDCIGPNGMVKGTRKVVDEEKRHLHRYDMSAFNIALGQMFNMTTPYYATRNSVYISRGDILQE
ncbi:unnamed protein product, partial [Owenia fusiformis]